MQNLFVKDDDEFKVIFWVGTDKEDGTIYCDVAEEDLKAILREDKEYEIKEYTAIFRKPSFGNTIELYDKIFTVNQDASLAFNPLLARFRKIALLIKSWDLKDNAGEEIIPSESNIMKLHPIISSMIGVQVDAETAGLLSQV